MVCDCEHWLMKTTIRTGPSLNGPTLMGCMGLKSISEVGSLTHATQPFFSAVSALVSTRILFPTSLRPAISLAGTLDAAAIAIAAGTIHVISF